MADRNVRSAKQADITGKQRVAPASSLRPNPWNYNVQNENTFRKLTATIKRHGFSKPVIVAQVEGFEGDTIIDGEHRWRAATVMGITAIPVMDLGPLSGQRARELTILLNELHGDPDEARLGALLRDVASSTPVEELESVMPFPQTQLDAYVNAIDFTFTNLPINDPMPDRVVVGVDPAKPGEDRTVSEKQFVIKGDFAKEIIDAAKARGMKPQDLVLEALRRRAAREDLA